MYSYDKNGNRVNHGSLNKVENYGHMNFESSSSSSSSSGGKHHWIFIVIGLVFVLILAGVIYFVYFRKRTVENFNDSSSSKMGMRNAKGFHWFKYPKK